jgi:hypothetical protein
LVSVLETASLRYDDGKTLNGIGTLASKSRLTGGAASSPADLSSCYGGNKSKGKQEKTLASFGEKEEGEREG